MSDAPSSRAALLDALEVRRYARLAVLVGVAVAVGVTLLFVGAVAGWRTDEPLWVYPSLAFVVFVTVAMLAAAVLVGRRVLRLSVHPAAIVRRTATGGLLAGLAWLAAGVALAFGPGPPWAAVVDVALPWAALLTPFGLWAGYTRYKRTAPVSKLPALAAVAGLLAALVLADLAAFDLVALLADVGGPVDPGATRLFGAAAAVLVGAQVGLAAVAVAGQPPDLAGGLRLGGPAAAGLVAFALLSPGRIAIATLALGLGVGWVATGRRLRGVAETDVPAGPDPWT